MISNLRAATLPAVMLLSMSPMVTAVAYAQVGGDPWFRTGTIVFSGELGGVAFSDFQRSLARSAADPELGDFVRRVSARTSVTGGASVSYWFSDGWAVRAGLGYAPSGFTVWNEPRAQRVLDARMKDDRADYASLGMWFADATMLFRLPARLGRIVPYGVAGGGVVEYRAARDAELPPEARHRFDGGRWRSLAAVFGVGLAVPLQQRGLLMSFEVTNHLTRTPLDDDGRGEWFELAGSSVQLERDPHRATDGIGLASNLRLTIGLSLAVRQRASLLPDQHGAARLGGLPGRAIGDAQNEDVPAGATGVERQVQSDRIDAAIGFRPPGNPRVRLGRCQAGGTADPAAESREQTRRIGGLQRELDTQALRTGALDTVDLGVDAECVADAETQVRPSLQDGVVPPFR